MRNHQIPIFFGIHAQPGLKFSVVLALVPFIILISVYLIASDHRHRQNPNDKLLPTITKMVDAMKRAAFLMPGINALGRPFITFVSIIPPLSILPILFITFGVDELAKVVLIFIGTFPFITRDIYLEVKKIPKEQIISHLSRCRPPDYS
jgi:NitT/TauT family transport system permease protein